jgi:hypothetical protein
MMKKAIKRTSALLMVAVLAFALGASAFAVPAPSTNFTEALATPLGTWSISMSVPVTILPANEDDAYYSFKANPGDRFYIRMSAITGSASAGMRLELITPAGQQNHADGGVVDRGTITAFRYVAYEVPAGTPSNSTFIIHIFRDDTDPDYVSGQRTFSPSFRNLFENGSGTFNFSGSASNTGNTTLNPNGTNSTVLTLNLTNNATIPAQARVRSVTTKSTMSPSQGNTHHHIANEGVWNTSIVSSATSGAYSISVSDGYAARANWSFRYNVLATAKSTMSSVSITINYEHNVTLPFETRLS